MRTSIPILVALLGATTAAFADQGTPKYAALPAGATILSDQEMAGAVARGPEVLSGILSLPSSALDLTVLQQSASIPGGNGIAIAGASGTSVAIGTPGTPSAPADLPNWTIISKDITDIPGVTGRLTVGNYDAPGMTVRYSAATLVTK